MQNVKEQVRKILVYLAWLGLAWLEVLPLAYRPRNSKGESRGIALLLSVCLGTRWVWVVSTTSWALFPWKDPVHIVQEAGWVSEPVWIGAENLTPTGFDPRTFQPVASRYTIYAISAPRVYFHSLNLYSVMTVVLCRLKIHARFEVSTAVLLVEFTYDL